jgi:uncharacterized protein YkwD
LQLLAACTADGTNDSRCQSGQRCGAVVASGSGGTAIASGAGGFTSTALAGSTGWGANMMLPSVGGAAGTLANGGSMLPGSAGMLGVAGVGVQGSAGMQLGAAGRATGLAGTSGTAGRASGVAGMAGISGAAGMLAGSAGAAGGAAEFEAERVACVDYINMYRATRMLAPLVRGSAAQEACSDKGAKKDGDSMSPHSSSGDCYSLRLFAQNTCPGYPVGAGGITKSLKSCLDQMWAEGEPPQGAEACKQDLMGCYPKYGHWINMTDPAYKSVVCSFYKMSNGNYWMNQNFGS